MQTYVNRVDIAKSSQTSSYLQNCLRYSRERASQSLPNISQRLEKRFRTNIGWTPAEREARPCLGVGAGGLGVCGGAVSAAAVAARELAVPVVLPSYAEPSFVARHALQPTSAT